MAAAKQPASSFNKGNNKSKAKSKVDLGKIVKDAAVNTAMVIGPGKLLKGAKVAATAAKTVGKIIKTEKAMKSTKLTKNEKDFVRLVKKVQRTEKTGNTTRMLSGDTPAGRKQASDILRKAGGNRSAVYKPTKKADPLYTVRQSRSTGKSFKMDSAGNIIKKSK